MRKFLFISVLIFTLALISACGSEGSTGSEDSTGSEESEGESSGDEGGSKLAELKEAGSITVGFANEAPYAYQDDSGELKGASVEVARAVFKELGIDEVKGQLADWGQLIPGVKTGKFDVITAGMAILPERCEQIDFAEPSIVYGEGMVVKSENPLDLHSYKDIAANPDVTVAVMSGATEVEFLKAAGVKEDQIETYSDIAATMNAVKTGRADATTATELTVKMAVDSSGDGLTYVEDFEQPDVPNVPSYGAAGFAPDSDELTKAYNEALATLKENGELADVITSVEFFDDNNVITEDITTEELCAK